MQSVAKVAGKDSSLLQISSDDREARGARMRSIFSEEDLTRHLHIMLRTHSELGYKQEQSFHLELGLLKMSHAQRLLPIEQLLSDAAASQNMSAAANMAKPAPRPSIVSSSVSSSAGPTSTAGGAAPRPNPVSPFAADSARKGTPRQESASDPAAASAQHIVASSSPPRVVMGAAAPAHLDQNAPELQVSDLQIPDLRVPDLQLSAQTPRPEPELQIAQQGPQPASPPEVAVSTGPVEKLRSAVLQALADGNQRILVSMLEQGEWSVEANELVIKVSESQTVVDMSLGADARRLAIASASGILGRAVKLKIVAGAAATTADAKSNGKSAGPRSAAGGRNRAEQDAVVRRLQEKFGAEIRTVIDYKEKR
jgi:DNA polymerase-3 subunit gamma/tau